MNGLFVGLLKARRSLSARAGVMVHQRAGYIYGKPPKDHIGAVESLSVLTVMTVGVLGPSCWILANLDHYKSRD